MTTSTGARIEADPTLPVIRIVRDFAATPMQLFRAHTDPDLFARDPERFQRVMKDLEAARAEKEAAEERWLGLAEMVEG